MNAAQQLRSDFYENSKRLNADRVIRTGSLTHPHPTRYQHTCLRTHNNNNNNMIRVKKAMLYSL